MDFRGERGFFTFPRGVALVGAEFPIEKCFGGSQRKNWAIVQSQQRGREITHTDQR